MLPRGPEGEQALLSASPLTNLIDCGNRPLEDIHEDEYDAIVIRGDQIDALEGWEWDRIFSKHEVVFARTSPKHKLEIVKHAQALGHIVSCTPLSSIHWLTRILNFLHRSES